MNEVKLSIITPCYNTEDSLKKYFNSISAQSMEDFEVLLIDDSSTDRTLEILNDLRNKDSRFKVSKNSINLGAGPSRNLCIEKAVGDYIMFIDSDDELCSKFCLEKILNLTTNLNPDVIAGNMNFMKNHTVSNNYRNKRIKPFTKNEFIKASDLFAYAGFQRFLYKSVLLKSMEQPFPSLKRRQDIVFLTKIMLYSERFYASNVFIYNYSTDNTFSNWNKQNIQDLIESYKINFNLLKKNNFINQYATEYLSFFDQTSKTISPYINETNDQDSLVKWQNVLSEIDFDLINKSVQFFECRLKKINSIHDLSLKLYRFKSKFNL